MTAKGQKALAGQVQHLRNENNKLKSMNFRLNNEIRLLQSAQLSMLEPNLFKAFAKWVKKWFNYRKS